ncbi:hypothetical protein LCGC14_0337280 [marine sediment metagenome]|uniref:VRR-NUC domain-containing protein n=1 Tax=marine sediment metagenome TaxID=412755 RepID=A0A0F9W1Y6_9ZZZZ
METMTIQEWKKRREALPSDKRPKKRGRVEEYLQEACVTYMNLQYPNILCIHIPNGGLRDKYTAKILKTMGVVAGAPDLFIFKPNRDYHGLAVELKTKVGKLTPKQKEFMAKLENNGYKYKIVRSVMQFIEEVDRYLSKKF